MTFKSASLSLDALGCKSSCRWLCEIDILFVSINSSIYTKSHQRWLGNWIGTQTQEYFTLNKNFDLKVYPDLFHFVLILSNSKILESRQYSFPLYAGPFRSTWLPPGKFAVLIFLPENRVKHCYQRSIPVLQTFPCTTMPLSKNTTLLNYPWKSEQHWVKYTFGMGNRV